MSLLTDLKKQSPKTYRLHSLFFYSGQALDVEIQKRKTKWILVNGIDWRGKEIKAGKAFATMKAAINWLALHYVKNGDRMSFLEDCGAAGRIE